MTDDEKKLNSYYAIIPSETFDSNAYYFFVEFASPEELETDTIRKETLLKISQSLGYDTKQWGWANWVWKKENETNQKNQTQDFLRSHLVGC